MDTSLTQTFAFQNQDVRTAIVNNEPWFALVDACKILGIVDATTAANRLDEDEKGVHTMRTLGGDQQLICANESGIYHLIFTSRKAEAKLFRRWVTHEVLPAIRKTGTYTAQSAPLQLPEKTTSTQAVAILQRLEDLVKEGQFHKEIPAYKHDNLEYCLKKTRGYFEGFTMKRYSVDDTDEDGNMYPHEYPPD